MEYNFISGFFFDYLSCKNQRDSGENGIGERMFAIEFVVVCENSCWCGKSVECKGY